MCDDIVRKIPKKVSKVDNQHENEVLIECAQPLTINCKCSY